jgi:hypothetical protein
VTINLQQLSEYSKLIHVTDWALLTTGIQIHYTFNGDPHLLIYSEAPAAYLLKKAGLIADFIVHNGWIEVGAWMETDGYDSLHWMEFGAFALHAELSHDDALAICATIEANKTISSHKTIGV